MKKPRYLFWLFDSIGIGLWAGSALVGGFIFSDTIQIILGEMTRLGQLAAVLVILVLVLFVLAKYFQRRNFYQSLKMPRILVEELKKMIDEGYEPLVLDVRSETARLIDPGSIPSARVVLLENLYSGLADIPHDREIITYCNCPNEASAALAARTLLNQGFRKVRPLKGGLDAWREARYPIESPEISSITPREFPIVILSTAESRKEKMGDM